MAREGDRKWRDGLQPWRRWGESGAPGGGGQDPSRASGFLLWFLSRVAPPFPRAGGGSAPLIISVQTWPSHSASSCLLSPSSRCSFALLPEEARLS